MVARKLWLKPAPLVETPLGLPHEADDLGSVNRFFMVRPFRWAGL
jgi:hypothetical protein